MIDINSHINTFWRPAKCELIDKLGPMRQISRIKIQFLMASYDK